MRPTGLPAPPIVAMVIRAADGEVEISGSAGELAAVAAAIDASRAEGDVSFAAEATADPRPYRRCLTSLDVRTTGGPVFVRVADDRLVVTGGRPSLGAFASFFQFPDDAPPGTHNHHEWFEGNEWVAPGSTPLVIAVA